MGIRKIVTVSAGTLMLMTNITPILADETYSMDTNTVMQICEDSIDGSSKLINDIIDGIEIEKEEPTALYNEISSVQQPVVYTYVEQEIPVEQTMSVDEFMTLYESIIEEEAQQVTVPVDTSVQLAAYDQALVNYNTALAAYEAANQMVETTKEVEVEIIEEVTDEEGNVTQVSHTEIQTVTEMVPAGDIVSAQANLDAAKAAFDNASIQLEAVQSQTTIIEQSKVEDTTSISTIIVEPEQEQKAVIEEDVVVTEDMTQAASGKCGDNLTWTLNDNGLLTISGTGDMADYKWNDRYVVETPWVNYKDSIKTIKINQGVTSIGDFAFQQLTGLTSITIPNSVTRIGQRAFDGCLSLTGITIPNSVISIGNYAFVYCDNLAKITFSNRLTSIGTCAFWLCGKLTSLTLPTSLTSIGESAFLECTGLTSVTIPGSLSRIERSAFGKCTSLRSVTIQKGVTEIGYGAFTECSSLTSIQFPNGVTSIEGMAFHECNSLTSVTLPSTVAEIDPFAFMFSHALKDVYYQGIEADWNDKDLNIHNDGATIHFLQGELPFKDVPSYAWYYDVAKECYKTGLINGTSPTTFSPMQTMTRAMVVTILWRMNGQPKTDFNNKFKDVKSSQWYATSISWAVNNGVVYGYGDGTFKPDAAVTREQVAVMLANYAGYKKVYKPGTKKLNTYPDGSQVSTYAQAGMKWALTNGIISGDGAGYLRPKKSATRAEGAAMLLRMNNWL